LAGAKYAKGRLVADSKGHRATLVAQLFEGVRTALEAGDLEAARVAHEAIGRLLGTEGNAAPVVDLARVRRDRGGR
jgi:hypothetical protein